MVAQWLETPAECLCRMEKERTDEWDDLWQQHEAILMARHQREDEEFMLGVRDPAGNAMMVEISPDLGDWPIRRLRMEIQALLPRTREPAISRRCYFSVTLQDGRLLLLSKKERPK